MDLFPPKSYPLFKAAKTILDSPWEVNFQRDLFALLKDLMEASSRRDALSSGSEEIQSPHPAAASEHIKRVHINYESRHHSKTGRSRPGHM